MYLIWALGLRKDTKPCKVMSKASWSAAAVGQKQREKGTPRQHESLGTGGSWI